MARIRIQIGDIFEIVTPSGLAYFQYTHRKGAFGALIRVLEGLYVARPEVDQFANSRTRFHVFFPVQAAANRGIVARVGNIDVPIADRAFPLFKISSPPNPATKERQWWLWDGEHEWRTGDLSPEYRNLPVRAVINDTLLIQRIVSGWQPSDELVDA